MSIYITPEDIRELEKPRPKSVWKFIISEDDGLVLNDEGEMQFPGACVVVADSLPQALSLALAYCQDQGLTSRRMWEWLFHCRVEQLPMIPVVAVYFVV